MKFELNKKEVERLEKIKKAVIELHDKEGNIQICFQTNGIGKIVFVKFLDYNIEKDITDYDCW